jgi:hypothetical protein
MIDFRFSRRPDQGEPSGFDLGDISVRGERGEITSEGHSPDQGMMIYLSLSLLLDQLRALQSTKKAIEFVGTDTSFTIFFKPKKKSIEVSSGGMVVGNPEIGELLMQVLHAAEEFAADQLDLLPEGDAGRNDLLAALSQFRQIVDR